jgi:gluconolactonase
LLYALPGYCHFDSMAVDGRDHVCVATLVHGSITVIRPDGGVEATVHLPENDPYVTNICFGGDDLRTAYVTSSTLGKLYAVEWPWPGLALNFSDVAPG